LEVFTSPHYFHPRTQQRELKVPMYMPIIMKSMLRTQQRELKDELLLLYPSTVPREPNKGNWKCSSFHILITFMNEPNKGNWKQRYLWVEPASGYMWTQQRELKELLPRLPPSIISLLNPTKGIERWIFLCLL